MTSKDSKRIWGLLNRLEGDKVVWLIVLLLLLLSIVFLSSSTSKLLEEGQTRLDIMTGQMKMVAVCLGLILVCYSIKNVKFLSCLSHLGFALSLVLLILLQLIGSEYNGAVRCIMVGGFQVHVFEVVKVAMVMYMAWAVDALKRGRFHFMDALSRIPNMEWLGTTLAKKLIGIYIPFVIVSVLVMTGSNSSAVFIAGIMALTIVIGGSNWKDLLVLGTVAIVALAVIFGLYSITKNTANPVFYRVGTAVSRLAGHDWEKAYMLADEDMRNASTVAERMEARARRQEALDKLRQPYSAKLAIHQGGFTGKGPGQSTQRYVVPDMSEDYMFSFILEEYGFLGAFIIIALYVSLIARSSLIARNCGTNVFAKAAVVGLSLLITGQAFLHIMVNADIGPMTGQTLPLLSHGNSALFCFSIAFGIILSISRIAQRGIEKASRQAAPLAQSIVVTDDAAVSEEEEEIIDEYDTELQTPQDNY